MLTIEMHSTPAILIFILFGHWVGDYLFQTTPMATQKATSIRWLTIHVTAYTAALSVFSFFVFPIDTWWKFALLNGALHWLTDLITSKLANRYAGNLRIFYPIIGFDQFVHSATLLITANIFIAG